MIDNLDDFKRYVSKYNQYPGGFGNRLSDIPNDRILERKFNNYARREKAKLEKANNKIQPFTSRDNQWLDLKKQVNELDKGNCQLLESLKLISAEDPDFLEIYNNAKDQYNPGDCYDPAHILSRGSTYSLRYDLDNVVTLKRVFHSRIDFGRNPVTGKLCSKEEIDDWWDIILESRSDRLHRPITVAILRSKALRKQ